MKRIISLLCVACLVLITACSDDKEVGPIFDSVLTPDFTFDDGAEIIAGVDAVQFTDNSTAKGTEISGYFWHFGFAGLGNWSEEAAPDPVMYKEAGEYVVTLTVYGADGNSSSTKRTIVVKAANLAPSASFTYTPETVVVDTEVTFTDTSVDSDGEIVARRWTLPDNTTSTEASVKYTFTKGGTFDVTLQVTDDRGASSEVSKKIFVAGDEGIGSGSESDPWQIATADRWNEIAQSINGTQPGDYKAGDYYLVTNDIDFSGKNFIAWDSFSGQLTGNGNSLKGITATRTVAEADIDADAAIFGVIRINSGTVKDLKIEATLTSNGNRIGGMTGRNNGTLDGVYFVKGTLTGVKRVGGIAGENNSVIVNCAVLGGNISSSGENAATPMQKPSSSTVTAGWSRSFHRGPIPAASSVTVAVTRLPSTAIRQRRPLSPGACTAELSDTSRRATCRTSTAIQRSASLWEERKTPAAMFLRYGRRRLPEPSRSER